jgi:hypothetical protein
VRYFSLSLFFLIPQEYNIPNYTSKLYTLKNAIADDTYFAEKLQKAVCECALNIFLNRFKIQKSIELREHGINSYNTNKISENLSAIDRTKLWLGDSAYSFLTDYIRTENRFIQM